MALSDRDIIITPNRGSATEPNILFRGADASNSGTITLTVLNTGSTAILRWSGSAGNLVSITNTSGTVLNVLGTAQATSTLTGALQVAGGVGIQGNLWVGGTINGTIAGAGSATTATNLAGGLANQIPYQTAPNTTGFITAPSVAGTVLTWNGSAFTYTTPAGTFNGGTITNPLFINNATPTSSTSTGAFVVLGGVGIGGGMYVGGIFTASASQTYFGSGSNPVIMDVSTNPRILYAPGAGLSIAGGGNSLGAGNGVPGLRANNGGSLDLYGGFGNINLRTGGAYVTVVTHNSSTFSTSSGAFQVVGGVGIGGGLVVGGITTVTNTTNASSTITGALVVSGGGGIGGNLYVGGNLFVNGAPITPIASTFNEQTATAGQTTFTIPGGYTPGFIQVFANGILLSSANYTATNGTTVVVNNARNAGDIMKFVAGSSVLGFTTSTFSSNILGGAANQLLVQTGLNTTGFVSAPVTSGTVLTWNGSAFVWNAASTGIATSINTVGTATSALFYPTFVDANNATATAESIYTTSSFTINPSTKAVVAGGQFDNAGVAFLATGVGGDVVFFGGSGARTIYNSSGGSPSFRTESAVPLSLYAGTFGIGGLTINNSGGVVTINTNSNASSTTTGALRVIGGAGIGGNLYVGGTIYQNGVPVGSGGTASGAAGVTTVSSATNATRYLTFVDNNYGSATTSSVYTDAGISYNPSTNDLTITGTFIQTPATLGSTLGNTSFYQSLRGSNGNSNLLETFMIRDAAGTDWTTAGTRIQQKIDSTWMGYMQFNGVNTNGGIEWGSGLTTTSAQAIAPRMRLTSDGVLRILTVTAATSTSTGSLVVGGGIGANGNIYTSGNLYLENLNTELVLGSGAYNPGLKSLILNRSVVGDSVIVKAGSQTYYSGSTNLDILNNSGGSHLDLRSYSSSGWGPTGQGVRLRVEGNNGDVQILNNTQATSTSTGALQVRGGLAVGGNIHFGGQLYQNGQLFSAGGGDPVVFNDISSKFDSLESVFTLKDGYYSTGTIDTYFAGDSWTPVALPKNGGGGAPPPSTTLLGTTVGAGSFVVPANVTSLTLEAWGGGGGSAGQSRGSNDAASGGAYAKSIVSVSAGQTVYYSIGAGGTGGSSSGSSGAQSWINVGTNAAPVASTTGARAAGGSGSGVAAPNNSTQAANSVGDVINIGGAGPAASASTPLAINWAASASGRYLPGTQAQYAASAGTSIPGGYNYAFSSGYHYFDLQPGTYSVNIKGAEGSGTAHGRGADINATLVVVTASRFVALVGSPGSGNYGGGGMTAIALRNAGSDIYTSAIPILVAGGGGGGYSSVMSQSDAGHISDNPTTRRGLSTGSYDGGGNYDAGAAFNNVYNPAYYNGNPGTQGSVSAQHWVWGGLGGQNTACGNPNGSSGGFGGGGGTCPGGGGGYYGGKAGGDTPTAYGGGGGTSYRLDTGGTAYISAWTNNGYNGSTNGNNPSGGGFFSITPSGGSEAVSNPGGGSAGSPYGAGTNAPGTGSAGGTAVSAGAGGAGGSTLYDGVDGVSNVDGGGGGGGSYNNRGGQGGLPGGGGGAGYSNTSVSNPGGFNTNTSHGFGGDGGRGQVRITYAVGGGGSGGAVSYVAAAASPTRIVAVAQNATNLGIYTDNGLTWNSMSLPAYVNWNSVTYGNDRFCTVSSGSNGAAFSTDGQNWTLSLLPSALSWFSVGYGNGVFAAVAYGTNTVAITSDNGVLWSSQQLPTTANWTGIAYGQGTFVAVANGTSTGAYSTNNGVTWNSMTLPTSTAWFSVTFGDGKFVAIANSTNIVAVSSDGINWVQRTLPSTAAWTSISWGNGVFMAVASGGITSVWSNNGDNWFNKTMPASQNWYGITYSPGLNSFISVGNTVTGAMIPVALSQSGVNIVDSKDLEVAINGQRLAPYVTNQTYPWILDYDSHRGFRVRGNKLIIYNTPSVGDSASVVKRNNSSSKQQRKYPFTAATIAFGD